MAGLKQVCSPGRVAGPGAPCAPRLLRWKGVWGVVPVFGDEIRWGVPFSAVDGAARAADGVPHHCPTH
jgi:hypothetical protein